MPNASSYRAQVIRKAKKISHTVNVKHINKISKSKRSSLCNINSDKSMNGLC